jgi:hypothetical protein
MLVAHTDTKCGNEIPWEGSHIFHTINTSLIHAHYKLSTVLIPTLSLLPYIPINLIRYRLQCPIIFHTDFVSSPAVGGDGTVTGSRVHLIPQAHAKEASAAPTVTYCPNVNVFGQFQ